MQYAETRRLRFETRNGAARAARQPRDCRSASQHAREATAREAAQARLLLRARALTRSTNAYCVSAFETALAAKSTTLAGT
eukprot:6184486-Pleurochrysis_carterae.AAC.2